MTHTPEEREYAAALQDAMGVVKVLLTKAIEVPEACRSSESRYRSQVSTIAEMVTDLQDFHHELFSVKKEDK